MLKELSTRTVKVKNNYIAEIKVFNSEENKDYYVVAQFGDLLYATFDGSWIDYKNGQSQEPNKIEGENYWWFNENNTQFFEFYQEAERLASVLESSEAIKRKYARLKKPEQFNKYEIVYKKTLPLFACGPMGDIYEMKVHMIDKDRDLYFSFDSACNIYRIDILSIIDAFQNDTFEDQFDEFEKHLTEFEGFSKAKKSKYYDIFLELEKFVDDYEQN